MVSALPRPKTAFVICEAGSDIRPLVDILSELGLRTLNNDALMQPGLFLTTTAHDYIDRADLICAVLGSQNSPNVYYELGYAMGQHRPIAIIGDDATVPMDLRDAFRIKASLRDRAALYFQLQAFLAHLETAPARPMQTRTPSKRAAWDRKIIGSREPELAFERDFLEALRNSSEIESVAQEPRNDDPRGFIPDFAMWLTASSKVLESPVIVELKTGLVEPADIQRAIEQVAAFARTGDVRTGLVVVRGISLPSPTVASLSPLIFVLDFDNAKQLLAQGRFVETLRRERNRIAHSAG